MVDDSGLPCRCADSINTRWREESDAKSRNGNHRRAVSARVHEMATFLGARISIEGAQNQDRKGKHRAQHPRWASVVASGKSLNPLVSSLLLSCFLFSWRNRDEFSFTKLLLRVLFLFSLLHFLSLSLFFFSSMSFETPEWKFPVKCNKTQSKMRSWKQKSCLIMASCVSFQRAIKSCIERSDLLKVFRREQYGRSTGVLISN